MFNKTLTFVVATVFHLIALPFMLAYVAFTHIGMCVSYLEETAFNSGWFDEDVLTWVGGRVAFVYSCFGLSLDEQ